MNTLRSRWKGPSHLEIIKTVLMDDSFMSRFSALAEDDRSFDAILFDSGAGSGKPFHSDLLAECFLRFGDDGMTGYKGRIIIAGGLNPENVGDAMKTFRPWGVDVVSGVEREPGCKDREKLKAFVAAVRKAEQ